MELAEKDKVIATTESNEQSRLNVFRNKIVGLEGELSELNTEKNRLDHYLRAEGMRLHDSEAQVTVLTSELRRANEEARTVRLDQLSEQQQQREEFLEQRIYANHQQMSSMNDRITHLEMRADSDRQDHERMESMEQTIMSMAKQKHDLETEAHLESLDLKAKLNAEEQMVATLRSSGNGTIVPVTLANPFSGQSRNREENQYKEEYDEMVIRHRLAEQWLKQVEEDEWRVQENEEEAMDESRLYQRMLSISENLQPRVSGSRKHEKIPAPQWPTVGTLLGWRAELISSVCVASNSGDTDLWTAWVTEAMVEQPDMDKLQDSGGATFASIDLKLGRALEACISAAKDSARDVLYKLKLLKQERGKANSTVKGREILAMILANFRTNAKDESMYNASRIHSMPYLGDKNLDQFWNSWTEVIPNIKPADVQSDDNLRDCLYRKIKDSQIMKYGLDTYRMLEEGDVNKSRAFLEKLICKTIEMNKNEKKSTR